MIDGVIVFELDSSLLRHATDTSATPQIRCISHHSYAVPTRWVLHPRGGPCSAPTRHPRDGSCTHTRWVLYPRGVSCTTPTPYPRDGSCTHEVGPAPTGWVPRYTHAVAPHFMISKLYNTKRHRLFWIVYVDSNNDICPQLIIYICMLY